MIRVETIEDDLIINKYYYDHGFKWISVETFEKYKEKRLNRKVFLVYYIWDLESMKKQRNKFNDSTIRKNDMYVMSSSEYIQQIRQKKLERILNI